MSSGEPESLKPEDLHFEPLPSEASEQPASEPPAGDSAIDFGFLEPTEGSAAQDLQFDLGPDEAFAPAEVPALSSEPTGSESLATPAEEFAMEPVAEDEHAPADEFSPVEPAEVGAFDIGSASPDATIDFTPPTAEGDDMAAGSAAALAGIEAPAEADEAGIGAAEAAAAAGITAGLLGIGATGEAAESAATDEVEEEKPKKEKGPSIFARLAEASPYTVMLGAAVLALLIASLCMLAEWMRYDFDTKAKSAKRAALVAPVERIIDRDSRYA